MILTCQAGCRSGCSCARREKGMYNTVIFDFDGTLADTGEGVFGGVRYALKCLGEPVPDMETLKKFIGPPLEASFSQECGLSSDRCSEAVNKYREYYSQTGIFELRFYDSAVSTLEALKKRGVKIGVGSSKPEIFLNRILEKFQLDRYFDCVAGAVIGRPHADKIGIINDALKRLGASDKNSVLMVGDRKFDVGGAHGAGIKCAGVLEGGYGTREELETAGADYVVETLADILDIVK